MNSPLLRPGMYVKVKAERGFTRNEASIYFGANDREHALVPRIQLGLYQNDYVVRIMLNSMPIHGKVKGRLADIATVNKTFDIPEKDIIILTMKDLRDMTHAYGSLPSAENLLEGEAYLEVMRDFDVRSHKGLPVKFDRKLSKQSIVYKHRTFFKNKCEGLMIVKVSSKSKGNLERLVSIEIPAIDNMPKSFNVLGRYIKSEKSESYKTPY